MGIESIEAERWWEWLMLGVNELKESITKTKRKVECPVKGCNVQVARRKGRWRRKKRFKCPDHNIYIYPSTFEYEYVIDNLLWHNAEDLDLLKRIDEAKRGSRMASDNSEDAVIWNVMRFLERSHLLAPVMKSLLGVELSSPEVIYWSQCGTRKKGWTAWRKAQREFGEKAGGDAGPDIIVNSTDAIIFIEARLTGQYTSGPGRRKARKKYIKRGRYWFQRVFTSDYGQVAVKDKRFELMRLWLLGTWMAAQESKNFCLVSLVREGREEGIEEAFGSHISESEERRFRRLTWEDIYRRIMESDGTKPEKDKIIRYFRNKALGYGRKGLLHKAFQT
jgi:hypothetical protein